VVESGGRLWIGTYGAGLTEIDRQSGRVVQHRQRAVDAAGLCGNYIWDLTPSARGTLWISTGTGVCRLDGGRFHAYGLPAPNTIALTLREDGRGRLWMGSGNGVYVLEPDARAARLIDASRGGLPTPIDALHVDEAGRIWMASGGSGDLASYDPETRGVAVFRNVAVEGVWDIESARDGALWLATGSGLTRFDPASQQIERFRPDDEAGSVFYSVLTDRDGRLWAGTNKGLIRYDPSARTSRRFDLGDGIGNLEFNRHAAFASDSKFFFGGMNGVTSFVPSEIRDNAYLPPVVLTAIQVLGENGERNLDPLQQRELTLSPGDYAVSFEFAALNYTHSPKNRFAYRLEGFDSDWIQAGTRRFARYTNLPPDRYVLKVRGTNNDGVPSPLEASLAVIVQPPFWATWWFRLAAGGLLYGGLFVAYKLRIRRLMELQQLRLRIASDLHDELGSELSGIALASRLIGRHDALTDKDRSRLADMASAAARITAGLRDIVWYISPEQDTLQSLEQRMKSVAGSMLDGITYQFRSSGIRPVPLDIDQKRHLFLIYKELLHNILRHAHATGVEITLEADQSRVRLEIADNGVGMSAGPTGGTGLNNIRRRADELGATLTIDSEPGKGTRIGLTAPMTQTRRSRRAVDA
jgi:signal transduction histidine kinase